MGHVGHVSVTTKIHFYLLKKSIGKKSRALLFAPGAPYVVGFLVSCKDGALLPHRFDDGRLHLLSFGHGGIIRCLRLEAG